MSEKLLLPQFLQKGDTIGVVAPAGQIRDRELFTQGVRVLSDMGFEVKFPRDLWPGTGYLADQDENRAREFHGMLCDPDVKALLSLRGGYGCIRMLPYLDLDLIHANPKLVIGFSDITILQTYLLKLTGLISIHGPVLTSLPSLSPEAQEKFFLTVTGKFDHPMKCHNVEILRSSPTVKGRLIGGNLASLVSLLGTTFDASWEEHILLLEDVNEPMYKVDRMLTQLAHAGKFNGLRGLLLGDFSIQEQDESINERYRYIEQIWSRVLDLCEGETYPIWGNLPCGHFPGNFSVPIGLPVEMISSSGVIRVTRE